MTNRELNEMRIRRTQIQLAQAARALGENKPVAYLIYDKTGIGGRQRSAVVHNPAEGKATIEIPQQGADVIMTLHSLEAVVKAIMIGGAEEEKLPFPTIEFAQRGEGNFSATAMKELQPLVFGFLLAVEVASTNLIVLHRHAKSRNIDPEQVARDYYEWLKREYAVVLASWPMNTMLVQLPMNQLPGGKVLERDEVDFAHIADKNEGHDDRRVVVPEKVAHIVWRTASQNGTQDDISAVE